MSLLADSSTALSVFCLYLAMTGLAGLYFISDHLPAQFLRRMSLACLLLLGLSWLTYLICFTATITDPDSDRSFLSSFYLMLSHTRIGHAQVVFGIGLLLLVFAVIVGVSRDSTARYKPAVAVTGFVMLACVRAVNGHAGSDGLLSAAVLAQTIHILSALCWTGAVLAFAMIWVRSGMPRQQIATRLSAIASVAFLLLAVTGSMNASRMLTLANLTWASLYGVLVLAKLIAWLAAAALGGLNRQLLFSGGVDDETVVEAPDSSPESRPDEVGTEAVSWLSPVITGMELMLLTATLLLASVLGLTMPN